MAEHVWSVLCYKGCQDKETNKVSLLDVIERVTARGVQVPSESEAGTLLIAVNLEFVSWWVRSDYSQPETSLARAKLIAPDGEEVGEYEFEVNLEKSTGFRVIAKIPGVPAHKGSGLFWFTVQQKRGESWVTDARVPLEIDIEIQEQGPTPDHPVSEA